MYAAELQALGMNDLAVEVMDQSGNFPLLLERQTDTGQDACLSGEHAFLELWNKNRGWIDRALLKHGALLFRGFSISSQEVFQSAISRLKEELLDYVDGDSPRTKLGGGVYTSTEYPSDLFIPLHNELSYSVRWPARLFFCCIVQPQDGGQTPLVSSRALLQALPAEIVSEFRKRKVRYVRNLHAGKGTGKSWQETFETTDRKNVDRFIRNSDMQACWNPDGSLRLISIRSATAIHPVTGDEVWFNQADQFHPSSLPQATYESLMALYEGYEDEMPENATFGDGSPIPIEYLQCIRETTQRLLVRFDWRKGDLLMVDNMLLAHGRMPFTGARKILVVMTAH
ncbi:MAG: TauD/TfdA family dioxygenase [Acidobacteriia bacterium]|nr:TauD/TfdA family dioxygenase [Terriglobia bacterium]